jgi:glycosyltransferase involved in cell wall biosynthesis
VTRDLRIVHVINSLDRGGAETNLARLCAATAPCGVTNLVLTLRSGGVLHSEVELHSRVVALRDIAAAVRLLRALRSADAPHLVVGWMYVGCVVATLLAPRSMPVVWSLRHVPEDLRDESRSTRIALRLLRRACAPHSRRRPAMLIANSAAAREAHQALGLAGVYRVIENGVDAARFSADRVRGAELRRELGIRGDDVLLLQVGRAHPHKGQQVLLDAAAVLLARHERVSLLMVGRGTETIRHPLFEIPEFARRVHRLGDRADLVPMYSAADLLINPSVSESFPTAVVEAMSCGLPCVVTDTGASRDIVGDTGRCVVPGSKEALLDAVEPLIGAAPGVREALGERARQRVLERFSLPQMAGAFIAAYRDAANAP